MGDPCRRKKIDKVLKTALYLLRQRRVLFAFKGRSLSKHIFSLERGLTGVFVGQHFLSFVISTVNDWEAAHLGGAPPPQRGGTCTLNVNFPVLNSTPYHSFNWAVGCNAGWYVSWEFCDPEGLFFSFFIKKRW